MNTITTTLITEAIFSDDTLKRFLLKKTWDTSLPKLAILMLAPSNASGIELDSSTLLVLNNASRLGYGEVSILNLFATLDDFRLKKAESEDAENLSVIIDAARNADAIIYAPGVGKAKNQNFQLRQQQVAEALRPYEDKLVCLCDEDGNSRLQHPLSPAVRIWYLSPLKTKELLPDTKPSAKEQKKKAAK